ncbi:MAG: N-acetylglucosamine-6-phosphate deacetylase, partial [Fuerstiella sp.]|nr:N-acetylglucosamine-6-phosphate deacetylase [Fuerstiella sp.]
METFLARHYETLAPIEITIEQQRISSIKSCEETVTSEESLPLVAPGLFDIQINGYQGIWFSSPNLTVEGVSRVTHALLERGVTRYFPTLITASAEALHHGFSTLHSACEQDEDVAGSIAGYHLEGPYISAEDGPRGAHPIQHVRGADSDEFSRLQEASGHRIRL